MVRKKKKIRKREIKRKTKRRKKSKLSGRELVIHISLQVKNFSFSFKATRVLYYRAVHSPLRFSDQLLGCWR